MEKDDMTLLIGGVVVAVIFSFIVSSMIFKSHHESAQVPVVESINSSLPDPYNDSTYKTIFNSNAIDPAQTTKIGNQNNTSPFNGTTN